MGNEPQGKENRTERWVAYCQPSEQAALAEWIKDNSADGLSSSDVVRMFVLRGIKEYKIKGGHSGKA